MSKKAPGRHNIRSLKNKPNEQRSKNQMINSTSSCRPQPNLEYKTGSAQCPLETKAIVVLKAGPSPIHGPMVTTATGHVRGVPKMQSHEYLIWGRAVIITYRQDVWVQYQLKHLERKSKPLLNWPVVNIEGCPLYPMLRVLQVQAPCDLDQSRAGSSLWAKSSHPCFKWTCVCTLTCHLHHRHCGGRMGMLHSGTDGPKSWISH